MLGPNGPNKRPTRVHTSSASGDGTSHVGQSTPSYLAEAHAHASASAAAHAYPRRPSHSKPTLCSRLRALWGTKMTIVCFLCVVLALAVWRHESTRPPRKLLTPTDPTATLDASLVSPHVHVAGHDHAHEHYPPTSGSVVSSASGPSDPPHVHPGSWEWEHEKSVPERRGDNFALNGEHASFNEERLRPLAGAPGAGPHVRSAGLELPGLVTSFVSPRGRTKLSILLSEEGRVGYMLDVARPAGTAAAGTAEWTPLLLPAFLELSANFEGCAWKSSNSFGALVSWKLEVGRSLWRPVPGNERRTFDVDYTVATVWCTGEQCLSCEFAYEFRLYDHAFAVRALVDGRSLEHLSSAQSDLDAEYVRLDLGMEVKFPPDALSECWAQNSEDPFVKRTCSELAEPLMTPITAVLTGADPKSLLKGTKPSPLPLRFVSLLQADGPAFTRSTGQSVPGESNALTLITKGELPIHAQAHQLGVVDHPVLGWATPTSWNVVLLAESAAALVHGASISYMLCPPPSERFPMAVDSRWVPHGKSLRVRGHSTAKAKYLVDFAATYNYQMIHFDAGWYGEETNKSSDPRAVFPAFSKDLNLAEVATYARGRGIGVTVYVNEIALKDTLDLIDIYPRWGLSGIKFGFVNVDSPRFMRVLHQRILAYQHVGMAVNVHDIFRPRGMTRTWPHLVTQEGVRGEERKPDATHHTILPFVRYLQGAADYTPRYLKGALKCTRAHQLALPFILFSPIQSLFWAEPGQAIVEAVQLYLPELIVWQMMPTTWDDTRALAGEVGEFASIARRTGGDWFIGSITNTETRELTLNLSQLFDHTFDSSAHPLPLAAFEPGADNVKGYMVHQYEDDHEYKGDLSDVTNLNNVKVKLRQTYILPAIYSTAISHRTRPLAAAAAGVFPNDPMPSHLQHLQEYRQKVTVAQEKQLGNMYTKETGKGIPKPTVLTSPLFRIKMAPSGGNVIYITPIL